MARFSAVAACAAVWVLLGLAHAPWRDLGGLVPERLRWLESFGVACCVVIGHALAGLARLRWFDGPTGLRALLYPVGIIVAATLFLLDARMADDLALVVVNGFLGYVAGILTCVAGRRDRLEPSPQGTLDSRATFVTRRGD